MADERRIGFLRRHLDLESLAHEAVSRLERAQIVMGTRFGRTASPLPGDRDLRIAVADVVAPELHRTVAQPGREEPALQPGVVDRNGVVLDDERGVEDRKVRFLPAGQRLSPALDEAQHGRDHPGRACDPDDESPPAVTHAAPPPRSRDRSP